MKKLSVQVESTAPRLHQNIQVERELFDSVCKLGRYLDAVNMILIVVDDHERVVFINKKWRQVMGYTLEEIGGKSVFDLIPDEKMRREQRAQYYDILSGKAQQDYIETFVTTKNQERLLIGWRISVEVGAADKRVSLLASGEDITEKKAAEEILRTQNEYIQLLHSITATSNEAPSAEQALQLSVNYICEYLGCQIGHVYMRTDENLLVSTDIWHFDDPGHYETFRDLSSKIQFTCDQGLVGEALASGEPESSTNIVRVCPPRARELREIHMRSGLAVPVKVQGTVAAVLEFFSTARTEQSDALIEVMKRVGVQLGVVLERALARRALERAYLELEGRVKERTEDIEWERAKVDAILENIGEGIVAVDRESHIIRMNSLAKRILGLSTPNTVREATRYDELITFEKVGGEPIPYDQRPITQALRGTVVSTGDYQFVTPDDRRIPVALTATPIAMGKIIIGAIVVFRDITREQEIDRAKNEFVSLASHQLRTPLSIINLYTVMLMKASRGFTLPQRRFLRQIAESTKRLIGLVGAILDVSKIDLGTFDDSPIFTSVSEVAEAVLRELMPHVKKKRLMLEKHFIETAPEIFIDQRLLQIVLQNVLTNSVKYTPAGGRIRLSIEGNAEEAIITVSDTGCGIPEHQQEKIFTKLFRADNAKERVTDGTGLGLYVAKSIVERAGGRIWFESSENQGTSFFIVLPARLPDERAGTPAHDYARIA